MFDNLSDKDFNRFSQLIYAKAGINLLSGKKELLRARLAKRLRNSEFKTFQEYYDHIIQDRTGTELVRLLDNVSTNLTSFFRENKHFEFLEGEVLPQICARKRPGVPFKIWSAGCSSGEEPYSIAMTIFECKTLPVKPNFKLLATDLSTRVLGIAKKGIYPEDRCKTLDPDILKKYFQKGNGKWQGHVRVKPLLTDCIQFARHNLMEPCPWQESLDIIFCRNVMIYFDKKTQEKVINSFYSTMVEGGYLFVGHSESLTGVKHDFKYIRPTIYQKNR